MSLGIPGKHIHIVGCSPRSGTTLLHQMMVACFSVEDSSSHEESAFKVFSNASIYCSKNPNEAPVVKRLLDINPEMYCLYLLRDPRDVVVSEHGNRKGRYFSNLRVWLEYDAFARKLIEHDRFVVVKYEDLVMNPDDVQAKISSKLPFLQETGKFSDFHMGGSVSRDSEVAMGGLRAVKTTSIGRWRGHEQRIADQLALHGSIDHVLRYWGYESSEDWQKGLPAPSIVMPGSQIPDRVGFCKRLKKHFAASRKSLFYWMRFHSPRIYKWIKGSPA